MKTKIILLLLFLVSVSGFAQNTVTGVVTSSEDNMPIPGVNVIVLGTTRGVSTDFDGNYSIEVSNGETLEFSYVGFQKKTIAITNQTVLNIVLAIDVESLDEVVVVGYGTAKKRDLAGSIVRVEGDIVANKPNANPVASLQGKVAGLSIVNSGQPGQEPDIRIRGTVSRNQTKPLYVVDGIFSEDISYINPNDIDSIELLKDPSSLAIFGVRGANGVILVTTKKGKEGKMNITFSASTGFKNITGKPELANAELFKTLYDERLVNDGLAPYPFYNLFTGNTDWIDQITNEGATVQNANLSIQSGNESNRISVGIGYLKEEGLIKHEELQKITVNINNEVKISDNLKVGIGINGVKSDLPDNPDGNYIAALNATPIVSPFNADGVYNQLPIAIGGAQIGNPLLVVNERSTRNINDSYRFVGNIFAELKLLKDFTFRVAYSGNYGITKGRGYSPLTPVYVAESDEIANFSGQQLTSVSQYNNTKQDFQQDYLLTYSKEFGDHSVTALLGFTTFQEYLENINGSVRQLAGGDPIPNDPRFWYLNVFPYGDQDTRISNSEQWDRTTVSSLFRVLYNYQGKYILNGSFRRDSSSELPKDTRDQNFWSLGAAWELSKEKFMENSGIDYLKIKGSYGELGNQYNAVHYPYLPNFQLGASAVLGNPQSVIPAFVLAYRNTDRLKWETVTSYEAGFELATFNNRLKFEMAYYNKLTKDLLVFVTSGSDQFYTNAGEIENKGFEFSTSWNDNIGSDFKYSISGNLSTIKNTVNSVFEPGFEVFSGPTRTRAGDPIGSFYGYEVEGLYQSNLDIAASPPSTLGAYGPGDFKYKDVNGDGVITPDDRTVIGNPTPDFTYGVSTNLEYKNFSLDIDVQGVYGNEVWRNWGNGSTFAQFNYRAVRENRWIGAGTSNWEPRLTEASGYNKQNSTYNIEDGSYVRIRNIQLGYNFKPMSIKGVDFQNMKLYANVQNLYTWKHNSGFTPEAGGTPIEFSIDNGGYPLPVITSLGFSITF
ncbi:MAG: TonB-dependent receptor [Flavobacteriales bacterium]|nr:TonB-dependent receptor [Flavobacteriales bacterium]NCP89045.1 TonB-dependent receptor [Flavobacteriales bacterium]NCQ15702.1 TonB-dependent receptor [Flavobacteriales bacterium]